MSGTNPPAGTPALTVTVTVAVLVVPPGPVTVSADRLAPTSAAAWVDVGLAVVGLARAIPAWLVHE